MSQTFQNAQAAISMAGTLTGTSGSMQVGNDTISWNVQGQLMGLKWKYVGIATSQTGKMGRAVTNSQTGAVEHALEDLFTKM
jgi:hypothetical protein